MPDTARGLGVDPTVPAQNLAGGARYLRQQFDAFHSWPLALAAYNAGPGAVQKYGGVPPYAETQHYVKNILGGAGNTPASPPAATVSVAPRPAFSPALLAILNQNNETLGLPAIPSLPGMGIQGSPAAPVPPLAAGAGGQPSVAPFRKGSSVGFLEKFASPFDLTITSTDGGKHAPGSYHYQGRAVDFGGPLNVVGYTKMAALARAALAHPKDFVEVIYTGPGSTGQSILNGRVVPNSSLSKELYAEHTNHVHLAR